MRAFLIAMALVLGGCAAQRASMYTRTDGKPIDPAQEQATLAQCKGEGAREGDPGDYGHKERAIITACMARNGYIQAQQ